MAGLAMPAASHSREPVGLPALLGVSADVIPPPAPNMTSPADGSVISFSPITIEGTSEPLAQIEIVAQPVGAIYRGSADAAGSWSVQAALSDRTHELVPYAIDAAGNKSPPGASATVTVDTLAPARPTISIPSEGSISNVTLVKFSGIAEPGSTLRLEEGAGLATLTVNGDGTWRTEVNMSAGLHSVVARVHDAAGHYSAATVRNFEIDTGAPAAPSIESPDEGAIVKAEGTLISGRGEPGADLLVFRGTIGIAATRIRHDGTWVARVTSPGGPNQIRARARDAAGNLGPFSAPRNFFVDTQLPVVEIQTPDGAIFLPGQPPLIEGIASDDLGVESVRLDFYDITGRGVASRVTTCPLCPTGTSVTWRSGDTPLVGRFVVRAYATDRVGNRSAESSIIVTIVRSQ